MKTTKNAYLEKLTRQIQMKSVKVGKNLEGSTPPSVFIGRWSYPKVYAGPMMANQVGNTAIMDSPESWIGQHKNQEDIIKMCIRDSVQASIQQPLLKIVYLKIILQESGEEHYTTGLVS